MTSVTLIIFSTGSWKFKHEKYNWKERRGFICTRISWGGRWSFAKRGAPVKKHFGTRFPHKANYPAPPQRIFFKLFGLWLIVDGNISNDSSELFQWYIYKLKCVTKIVYWFFIFKISQKWTIPDNPLKKVKFQIIFLKGEIDWNAKCFINGAPS